MDGVIADSIDDLYNSEGGVWNRITSANLSNGGKTVTLKGINKIPKYAAAVDMRGNTVSSAGNYTISIVVDADGDGSLYEPSNPATITLKVQ
ncbi:hypothetical protein [Psychrobacillus sp.]|uniref:hypothetical protein n=1 Tax=Psychrobacillus sp. TaxID=1871623 RepID=UPI0028BF584B|nr:hypothetical protein [Psychrobacillus sp.]